jgi:DnaJ-class molecular chaperone
MSSEWARWREQVLDTAARLDEIDYFRLLGCPPDPSPATLRTCFRRLATSYHPDRYRQVDPVLYTALETIYRRITEAYAVLRDPHDRAAYSAGLSQGFVRFDRARAHELLERARQTVEPGQTEAGRRHYQQACAARDRNDRYTAREEIRMALLFEPSEPQFLILAEQLKGG